MTWAQDMIAASQLPVAATEPLALVRRRRPATVTRWLGDPLNLLLWMGRVGAPRSLVDFAPGPTLLVARLYGGHHAARVNDLLVWELQRLECYGDEEFVSLFEVLPSAPRLGGAP